MHPPLVVEEWDPRHARWQEVLQVVESLGQSSWATARFAWHRSSHMLVAHLDGHIVGFLRFVIQPIGIEDDHAPVFLHGDPLTEAKILAFGVAPAYRRQGIGRALQNDALKRADRSGCYQLRSYSGGDNDANHHLKLAMGFGIQPVVRGEDVAGAYFIMPLRAGRKTPDHGEADGDGR